MSSSTLFSNKENKISKEIIKTYLNYLKINLNHIEIFESLYLEKSSLEIVHNLFYQKDNGKDIKTIIFIDRIKLIELYKIYLINDQFSLLNENDRNYLIFSIYIKFLIRQINSFPIDNILYLIKDIYLKNDTVIKGILSIQRDSINYKSKIT